MEKKKITILESYIISIMVVISITEVILMTSYT